MADYPKGKTLRLPSGSMRCTFVGSKTVTTHREGNWKPNVSQCADAMSIMVPGASAGKVTWERD